MGRTRTALIRSIVIGLATNALAVLFFLFVVKHTVVYGEAPTFGFSATYFFTTLALGTVLLGLVKLGFSKGILVERVERSRAPKTRTFLSFLTGTVLGFLIGLFFFVPLWFGKTFGDIPADHFMFLLTEGNGESTKAQDLEVLNLMVVPVIATTVIGACLGLIHSGTTRSGKHREVESKRTAARDTELTEVFPNSREAKQASKSKTRGLRGPVLAVMCALLVGSVAFAFNTIPLAGVLRQEFSHSDYIERNYVLPTADNVTMPKKKRNLIHIYMESVENSYYSKNLGGYMEDNLMPELAKLSDTGVSFSNTDKHGGPEQLYASGHSIAAMVNMWAGTPMLASGAGNGTQMSYPDFPTIGDILHNAGYNTEFMLGANGKWGGLGDYYRRHGDFHVFDHPYAKSQKLIPEDYHVWWGFEDDKLYEFAKTDLTRLGADSKPFYFVLENADTHFPDGYASERMTERSYEKHYANVIKYSQKETVKLIKWIQQQPWAKDTTIVVTGDHRSMDKDFFQGWDKNYNRTVVNFILNPVQNTNQPDSVTKNRTYAPFDFFPTILSAIGAEIKDGRLGLGTDLFTGKPTLAERDGVAKLNKEFAKNSPFYDSHRETKAETPDIRQDQKF